MTRILTYYEINPIAWQKLVDESPYATWFQTQEAYQFYAANKEEMTPFAYAVAEQAEPGEVKGERLEVKGEENSGAGITASTPYTLHSILKALCVGYITREHRAAKQFFTRRAIIIGGPLLAEDATEEEVSLLLNVIKHLQPSNLQPAGRSTAKRSTELSPIYFETRNFHDYSRWKEVFQNSGFAYQPHLNFHVDTTSVELVESNLGKNRKRDIKTSIRDGATIIEQPTIEQVREYYTLLKQLYTTKIKTPLFSLSFFEQLYAQPNGRFILVELNGEIIGGTVCVELPGNCLYEWFVCGRDGEWKSIFPSSLATYAGIRYAAEHGCSRFDMMGAGKPDEAYGVRDFKARFGGEQVEHGRFLCIRKPLLYWIGKLGVKILKKR